MPPCLPRPVPPHLLLALPGFDCGVGREGACAGWAGRALKIRGGVDCALWTLWTCFSVRDNVFVQRATDTFAVQSALQLPAQPPAPWGPVAVRWPTLPAVPAPVVRARARKHAAASTAKHPQ